ncbi:MAG TPA: 2-hydroxychromene-2-carboxylate isomerase, partial [Gammaproteobacteria bacterium]|nr:2-hydroxychromene-2-carboxylate isomerase [Gammaproteobacteria bacterium]
DAPDISASLWAGELVALDFDAAEIKAQGDAVREKLGHYLSAMCYYEGEWYWGLDRL